MTNGRDAVVRWVTVEPPHLGSGGIHRAHASLGAAEGYARARAAALRRPVVLELWLGDQRTVVRLIEPPRRNVLRESVERGRPMFRQRRDAVRRRGVRLFRRAARAPFESERGSAESHAWFASGCRPSLTPGAVEAAIRVLEVELGMSSEEFTRRRAAGQLEPAFVYSYWSELLDLLDALREGKGR